jgi:hypothetical protein
MFLQRVVDVFEQLGDVAYVYVVLRYQREGEVLE